MSKHIIIATLLATAALILLNAPASSTNRVFEAWKDKFAVTFETSADEFYRKSIF